MSADPRIDERIFAYLDGGATPEEVADLECLLAKDRAVSERFARLCEEDLAIRQLISCGSIASVSPRRFRARPVRSPARPWVPVAVAAACLVFGFLILGALSSGSRPKPADPQIARPRGVEPPAPEPVPPPRPIEAPKAAPPPPERPLPLPKPEPPPSPPAPAPLPRTEPPVPPATPTPEPPPAPKRTEAAPAPTPVIARVEGVKGPSQLLTGTETAPAADGLDLRAGQGLETIGAESVASIRFSDAVVELSGETRLSRIGADKRLALDRGRVTAQVGKQPAGQAFVFATPHAEARVLGTKLTLIVSATETRLEVREGRVRLTRLSDQSSVDVGAGQFAVASDSIRPAVKKIPVANPRLLLSDDFEEGFDARWQKIEGGFPITTKGALEVNLAPRPGDPYAGGGWHIPGGLRSKATFPLPFRITADVECTHSDASVNLLVTFLPKSTPNDFGVRLRAGQYSIIVDNVHVKQADRSGPTPVRERWTIELGPKEIDLMVNGKPVLRHAHGLTLTDEYRVELQGAAKLEAPAGARVRFDGVRIER